MMTELLRHERTLSTDDEYIGYCEGLCGGLLSHHLVGGLCPQCRIHPNIAAVDPYEGIALGAEADVGHVHREAMYGARL